MALAKREFPPRLTLGAHSRRATRALASWAERAATRPALPPPTTITSYMWKGVVLGEETIVEAKDDVGMQLHGEGNPAFSAVEGTRRNDIHSKQGFSGLLRTLNCN